MMQIEKPKILVEENADGSFAKVVIEPLERGFGTTLGNSFRRILYASLPGIAPVAIRIAGVAHEFSNIKGVKEDVSDMKNSIAKIKCDNLDESDKELVNEVINKLESIIDKL